MSSIQVVGIDVGGQHLVIAQAKRGGVDVILNEASKRLTPALVSFAGDERFMGDAATTQIRTNLANTITSLKNIVGRKFSEEGVQEELATYANYKAVAMENDEIGIEVRYNDETRVFSATQVMGMLLCKAREIVAQTNPGLTSIDTVIAVPSYYTSQQRVAMHEAATIARLNCMALINEGTAAALSYGIFRGAKREFDDSKETLVAFTDMGYSRFTVTIASFTNTSLKILASASDSSIGGRHLDHLIAKHLADDFKAKTGLDAWANPRARLKLVQAAEKAKTTLSPYGVNEAPINIECLLSDTDYSSRFSIDEFENLAGEEYKTRVAAVIKNALANASKTGGHELKNYNDFAAIELIGGSARPRLVKRAIATALEMPLDEAAGHGLNSTMNLDEAIARGCALASAKLSHVFKVREYHVHDTVVLPLAHAFSTMDDQAPMEEDSASSAFDGKQKTFAPVGLETPFVRRVAVNATSADAFRFRLYYDMSDEFGKITVPKGTDPLVLEYVVGPLPEDVLESGKARVRVSVKCNESGILSLASAEVLKEIKEEPVKMEEDAAPPAAESTEEAPPATAEGQAPAAEEGTAEAPAQEGEAPAADGEAAAPEAPAEGQAPAPEAQPQEQPKPKATHKKYKKIPLDYKSTAVVVSRLQHWIEEEDKMAAQDQLIRDTQDCRNSLETYIYKVRNDLEESLVPYTTAEEREKVSAKLWEEEDWVTGDGFDSDKATFQKHLDELTALCHSFYFRRDEAEKRYSVVEKLQNTIEHFKTVLENKEGKWNHLLDTDFDALRSGINGASQWLKDKQAEQSTRELYQEPAFTCADVTAVTEQLVNDLRPIELKPVPKPPTPAEEQAPEAAPVEGAPEAQPGQETAEAAEGDVPMDDESAPAEEAAPPTEDAPAPMETEQETSG